MLAIVGMSIVTYIPRMAPLVVMSKIDFSEYIRIWLEYVPISILTILLTLNFVSYNKIGFDVNQKMILASVPTVLVAMNTKSLIKTVLVGIVTMTILNFVIL